MNYLWPIRTGQTFFDAWSVIHLCFWVFIASNFFALKIPMFKAGVVCLFIAFLWEIFERFAEPAWPAIWRHPESWINSWVSDPLTAILGVLIAYSLLKFQP
jgi:hypothetical protein